MRLAHGLLAALVGVPLAAMASADETKARATPARKAVVIGKRLGTEKGLVTLEKAPGVVITVREADILKQEKGTNGQEALQLRAGAEVKLQATMKLGDIEPPQASPVEPKSMFIPKECYRKGENAYFNCMIENTCMMDTFENGPVLEWMLEDCKAVALSAFCSCVASKTFYEFGACKRGDVK